MPSFSIGTRQVGDGAPVFLVAELSANHGANKDVALRTIEAAAKAGADAIKLQTYTPDTLTLASNAEPFVVKTKNEWAGRTLHDLYAEAMTPWEWHAELKAAAEAHGLVFFSTPFDVTAVEYLERLGVLVHKIASFELTDLPLVAHVARRGHPMIMSTGMASLGEIESAVATCRAAGNDSLALLRCVSAYPAVPEAMDLRSLNALSAFGTVVGLSDHTRDATAAITAVALGAKLVEKHFILDRSIGGPDAFFSLDPAEFQFMVRSIRDAEKALGRPRFGPSADEVASLRFRRSLFAAKAIKKGEMLTADNVRSVRPADGIPARHLSDVLGRTAAADLDFATPLRWEHVGERPRPALRLRPASAADADFLFRLRNDELTRKMSRSTVEVTRADHESWLVRVLDDSARALFIAEVDGVCVGQVRLDRDRSTAAELSLTVAREHRGKGHATAMLRAAEIVARASGVSTLLAVIRVENERSVAAFKAAGYHGFVNRILDGAEYFACERGVSE